jgi:hypothetical protein
MTMFTVFAEVILAGVIFTAGGALIWFFKPKIQELVIGANKLSAKLHAQADALSAKATAAVDAVKKV